MGLDAIITFCIAFVIIVIFIGIYNLIKIPSPNKPALDNIPPAAFTSRVWAAISRFILMAATIIVIVMFCFWVAWHFLKFISPFILGFGDLIILMIPIFGKLEDAGIFQLFDDIIGSVITLDFKGIFAGLARFFNRSGKYIAKNVAAPMIPDVKVVSDSNGTPIDEKKSQARVKPTSDEDTEEPDDRVPNQDATEESKYTAQQHKNIQTRIEMCIAENTIPIDPETATFMDKLRANVESNKISLLCKSQALGSYK